MRIAVVGGGGREHALLVTLAQSPDVERLYAVPGNAGTAQVATNVGGVGPADAAGLAAFVEREGVDLTIVGPEQPLVAGVADEFLDRGLALFGPTAAAARIEGSKAFAKEIMAAAGVPTARAEAFADAADAVAALDRFGPPWVVKADGLAAGKGVTVTDDRAAAAAAIRAALVGRVHGEAGARILLEEHLEGPEASLLAVTDGRTVTPLAPARDHKRVGDGDQGPNTGGMGAYSPLPDLPDELVDELRRTVLEPTVAELLRRGVRYQGVLYAGLTLTADGPRVLEFNCRFGDPEAQAILPRMSTDLADLAWSTAEGTLAGHKVGWDPRPCVTVVLASGGYPGSYRKGLAIDGLQAAAAQPGVHVFHAGTALDPGGRVRTTGGRVLAVTALGDDLADARARAYQAADLIHFDGMHYRRDIAAHPAGG
jgi:phosphoribosylamine---glycine ligase